MVKFRVRFPASYVPGPLTKVIVAGKASRTFRLWKVSPLLLTMVSRNVNSRPRENADVETERLSKKLFVERSLISLLMVRSTGWQLWPPPYWVVQFCAPAFGARTIRVNRKETKINKNLEID